MHFYPMTSIITQAHIYRDALPLPKQTKETFHAIKHSRDQRGALSRP